MVALNVLVYSGPGIGPNAHAYLLRTLRQFLSHRYAVIPPWESKAALLVMPGGRDQPYVASLSGEINARIRHWISRGGRYLGFCAGGYYGSGRCEFEPKHCDGSDGGARAGAAYPGYHYKTEDGARAAEVTVDQEKFRVGQNYWRNDPKNVRIYYNGGGYFLTDDFLGKPASKDVEVLVRYANDVTDPYDRSKRVANAPALIACRVGRGQAILTGLHPDYTMPYNRQLIAHLRAHDAFRRRLLGAIFAHLNMHADAHSMRLPARTPTFLAPARAQGVAQISQAMYGISSAAQKTTAGDAVLRDAKEDIHVISASPGVSQRRVPQQYQATVLKPKQLRPITDDGETEPRARRLDPGITPRFDMQLAITYMQQHRAHTCGSWLMYSDTTSSTQTFLESNTRLQSLLPNGTVNVATVQLAGRGRGRNAWVAPLGCLQFTMLLRHPGSKKAPVVLLQYLVSLAIVEAVKQRPGYEDLPMRLKWPNDLYGRQEPLVDSDDSDADSPEFVKLGGVLVGSSFKNGEFSLLFGMRRQCGQPAAHDYNDSHGTSLPAIPMELALALITAKFEEFYRKFLVMGFAPFLDMYYKNWLHSNQIVTLVDQGHERVRITGVDPDTGLLLTRSIHNPNAHYSLQPDGNSFDMLQGMISRKT
ncbi:class II aaRS and biotin synthetase [Linderina pennispora]|uniref:Class II aaRS and biotin synthetase n=1 Tax=Linderina pennispora TaxID=61395 RepID=A0A1Y1W4Q7_9FUNG|nr:class II aaRS and biotin synthetase [Linderina pennispora]ORX68174.1 class II aaRS and biotin synthetase [Linderina pennispora]